MCVSYYILQDLPQFLDVGRHLSYLGGGGGGGAYVIDKLPVAGVMKKTPRRYSLTKPKK